MNKLLTLGALCLGLMVTQYSFADEAGDYSNNFAQGQDNVVQDGQCPADHPAPGEQSTGDCWCKYVKYEPCYYTTKRCVQECVPCTKRCCRLVPKYYDVQKCKMVPQYYTETACKQEKEYYDVPDTKCCKKWVCVTEQVPCTKRCCRMVPKYYEVQKCKMVPQYYTETACRQEKEYYDEPDTKTVTKEVCEQHCKYVPKYYWKHTCGDNSGCTRPAPSACCR